MMPSAPRSSRSNPSAPDARRRFTRLLYPLLVTALLMPVAGAAEDDWYPSRFGADDRLGAVNLLGPEVVLAAADLITTGKTYPLGVVTGRATPAYGPRSYDITVLQTSDGTGASIGANRVTGNDDLLRTWMGIGSQIDGLGHLGIGHRYYNGVRAEDFVTTTGLTQFGTHAIPPIVTRGVLLDMTRVLRQSPLPAGTAINREQIEAAADAEGIEIREGDVVLLHTGWQALAETDPETFISGEPGLGVEGAEYLAALGVVAVGADCWGVEAVPFEQADVLFPVHQTLLAKHGVYLLESMNTAELAADRAWEFFFVLGQPRFEGAVQAIINPVAIR